MKVIGLFFIGFMIFASNILASEPDVKAPYVVLMDFDSGSVLFERGGDISAPPSSMSKLLTTYRIFEKLKDGTLTLDMKLKVGPEAWKKSKAMNANSGSTMFLEFGEETKVEDLIRGVIVNSGNDATIVFAENISGSEAKFTDELNILAKRLGLNSTNVTNASGWYEKNHLMSAIDIAILSRRLILDFPEYYHYFGEKEFLYKKDITGNKDNRNKLLWIMPSSDGLKTGHTAKGGYGLSSSAKRGERRLIAIVNGLKGINPSYTRFTDSKSLLEWGFKEFKNVIYYNAGDKVLDAPVWFGAQDTVPLGVNKRILITTPEAKIPNVEFRAVFSSPIPAPVIKDTVVGKLYVYADGSKIGEYELLTLEDIKKCNFIMKIFKNIKQIVLRSVL